MSSRICDCATAILDQYRPARISRDRSRISTARALFNELCRILSMNPALRRRLYVEPISRIGVAHNLQRCPQVWLQDNREWRSTGWIETVVQFPEDMSGIFLGICVGSDDADSPSTSNFRRYMGPLTARGFASTYQIDLRVAGGAIEDAEIGWVASKWYGRAAIPDDSEFSKDLTSALQACDRAYQSEGHRTRSKAKP